jgi:hypothetical protein
MEFRYTRHQVARGARADAEAQDKLYLLKNVSALRLTYQVRLLTFRASESRKRLVLQVPKHCKIHSSLRDFVKQFPQAVRVEKV